LFGRIKGGRTPLCRSEYDVGGVRIPFYKPCTGGFITDLGFK
jgi:hypothetical protein